MSRLIQCQGAVDLKGFFKHFLAYSIPLSQVLIDLTPSQISANYIYRLQDPAGTSLIDLSNSLQASSVFWLTLRRLAQQRMRIQSWGFLAQARLQKYSASSQSSDSYFYSAIWKRLWKGSSSNLRHDINNRYYYYNNHSMQLFYLSLVTLYLFLQSAKTEDSIDSNNREKPIYGIRWFLAQSFRYNFREQADTTQADFMVLFNTQEAIESNFQVKVEKNLFSCQSKEVTFNVTDDFHPNFNNLTTQMGSKFTTFIYRCPVRFSEQNFLSKHSKFVYSIISEIQNKQVEIFAAEMRSPIADSTQTKAVVVGDWGKITAFSQNYEKLIPIDGCLSASIEQKEVNLLIILGDVGYDMQGQTYIDFLTYLEPYSSRLPILFTPGNHETSKHPSIFNLVIETFYSPFWSDYFGYFDLVKLKDHLIFAYNPDSVFTPSLYSSTLQQQHGSHISFLYSLLPAETIAEITANYSIVSISHYPIFCSQEDEYYNCSINRTMQKPYLQLLRNLQVELVLGAHLHYYQRTKPVCDLQGRQFIYLSQGQQENVYYKGECPVFVVEGAAGNNYYLPTQQAFPLKPFSAKFASHTGFGLLTLSNTLSFEHITTQGNCTLADQFSLIARNDSLNVFDVSPLLVIFLLMVILIIIFGLVWYMYRIKHMQSILLNKFQSSSELAQTQFTQR